jgi:hypothetical protein
MRALDRSRSLAHRLLASRRSFSILCLAYGLMIAVIMMPVLAASIGADDTYWTLNSLEATEGSALNALGLYLGEIIAPDTDSSHPRTVALALAARRALAVLVLQTSVAFSIPVAIPWALAKIVLLLVTLAAVAALLCQIRFRAADGEVRGLSRDSIVFVLLVLPLAIALGIKAQGVGGLNGWVEYPVLTYSALPTILATAALSLWLIRKLERDYRAWVWPAVGMLALVAVVLNYSYEFVAIAIPVSVLAVLLHPRREHGRTWRRWRPHLTVALVLAGAFSLLFVVNRWRLTTFDCVQDGSCYSGSSVALDARTLLFGFVGALPSSATETIMDVVEATGRTLPTPFTVAGLVTGLLAVLLLVAAWRAWCTSERTSGPAAHPPERGSDDRGLGTAALLAFCSAIGVSVVSSITRRAIDWLDAPELSYRSGPAVWAGIALAGVLGLRWLLMRRRRALRRVVALGAGGVAVLAVGHLLPLNSVVAQAERAIPRTQAADAIHWDVVLGDLTAAGEARRCEHAARWTRVVGSSTYYHRTIRGAESAFQFLYGMPYCAGQAGVSEGHN